MVFAEDGENSNPAVTLGWSAIGLGIAANLLLVAFKIARKRPIAKIVGGYESSSGLTPFYKPVLNLHIMLNSVGFFAGVAHGIIMTFSMASGIVLKYASEKNLKFFGRLAHGQFILAVLLIVLVALHVIIMNRN